MDDNEDLRNQSDSEEDEEKERRKRERFTLSDLAQLAESGVDATIQIQKKLANDRMSPEATENSPKEDDSSSGNRDEEDEPEEDEEADDREDAKFDSERLKAFNMFVRLFVDENLDRIIPISKQPKEKIQAIIDSCSRQFPEFVDRSRKRLRTYLKSCRRNKRGREGVGSEGGGAAPGGRGSRPTPPHLTSVQAEQILAQACENESQNAKRMRVGLDPISQPMPQTPAQAQQMAENHPFSLAGLGLNMRATGAPPLTSALAKGGIDQMSLSSGMYQPNFSQAFGQVMPGMLPTQGFFPHNGKVSTAGGIMKAAVRPQLTSAEVTAVRQLITGYRESANFLRRSADELELLIQQSGQ